MWFPYSLPVRWKAESERSRIDESLADTMEREFLIGFYLHSRITGEWGVEIHLEEPHWVTGTEQGKTFSVGYYPNETARLAEIICRMQEANPAKALRRSHAHVSRTLSCWSAVKGRAFAVLGFRIADLKHNARWRALPHRPSDESFELPSSDVLPESYRNVMALYREARNSSSDTYRFLCCHKIFRLWAKRAEPFNLSRESAAELGFEVENFDVTREMLVLSGMIDFRPDLEGTRFSTLLDSIEPWREWAVATLISERFSAALDDYEQGLELASVTNLVDLTVHRLFASEIKCWQSIMDGKRDRSFDV